MRSAKKPALPDQTGPSLATGENQLGNAFCNVKAHRETNFRRKGHTLSDAQPARWPPGDTGQTGLLPRSLVYREDAIHGLPF